MTDTLQLTEGSLRVHLDEPTWSSVVASADVSPTSLDPLTDAPASADPADPVDPAVREAAVLALGATPIVLDLVTGHGDRGLLARIGTDGRATASAVRALVPRPGTTPRPAPGVELSTTLAAHVVGEVMRLFPPIGLSRQVSAEPLVLPQEVALPAVRALTDDDVPVALRALRTAGLDHVPDVLDALGRGPTASATLTLTALGRVITQQWLCTDVGWVALGVTADEVTHTVRSRDEIRTDVVALVAGAFDALGRVTGEARDG